MEAIIISTILFAFWVLFCLNGRKKEKIQAKNEKIKWPKAW